MHAGAGLIGCMPIAGEPRDSKQVDWRELYNCMLVVTDLLVGKYAICWLVSMLLINCWIESWLWLRYYVTWVLHLSCLIAHKLRWS